MPYKGSRASARETMQNIWKYAKVYLGPYLKKRKSPLIYKEDLANAIENMMIVEGLEENIHPGSVSRYISSLVEENIFSEIYGKPGFIYLDIMIFGRLKTGEDVTYKEARNCTRGISNKSSRHMPKKRRIRQSIDII